MRTEDPSLAVAVDLRIADRLGMERAGVGRYAVEATRALCRPRPGWSFLLGASDADLERYPKEPREPMSAMKRLAVTRSDVEQNFRRYGVAKIEWCSWQDGFERRSRRSLTTRGP